MAVDTFEFHPIANELMEAEILNLNPNKAKTFDSIPVKILKFNVLAACRNALITPLHMVIFQRIWKMQTLPLPLSKRIDQPFLKSLKGLCIQNLCAF